MSVYFEIKLLPRHPHLSCLQLEIDDPPLFSFLLYLMHPNILLRVSYLLQRAATHLSGIFHGIFSTIEKDTTKSLGLRGTRVLELTSRFQSNQEGTNVYGGQNGGKFWRLKKKFFFLNCFWSESKNFFRKRHCLMCRFGWENERIRYGDFKSKNIGTLNVHELFWKLQCYLTNSDESTFFILNVDWVFVRNWVLPYMNENAKHSAVLILMLYIHFPLSFPVTFGAS